MRFENMGWVANGDISTARFVKLISGTKYRVAQAAANEQVVGVSTQNQRASTIIGTLAATTLAASAGESLDIELMGSLAWVEVGSACVEGDWVKSDANGRAVPIATSGATKQMVGGLVLIGAANANELALIQVNPHRQTMD